MVTIKEHFVHMLIERGMSMSQANEVMDIVEQKGTLNIMEDYNINMNGSMSAYPGVIYNILYSKIKPIALEWIENNKPQAWFKPMFETEY